jgi:Caspase domain/Tetratricopeptide repeat
MSRMRLPDGQRSRALLIGTSTYTDPELPALDAVTATVNDLYAALTIPDFGVFPPEHCAVLLDEAEQGKVGRVLRTAAKEAEELLLVYFAGHGLLSGRRHDLYLALRDSDYAEPEFDSLEYDKLRNAVLNSRARTKVIILDCCFGGRAVTDTMAAPGGEIASQVDVDGTYVLTAAPRDKVALILKGEKHTAFTGRMLRLLSQGIPGAPEFLTIHELYQRLEGQMRAEGLPIPEQRGTRNAGQLPLVVNRAFARTAAPLLRKQRDTAMDQAERTGDWATAAGFLGEVHEQQVKVLGSEHADALRTLQLLGLCVSAAGDPARGAQVLTDLLPRQLKVFGPDHLDCLKTRQLLAVALGESGARAEAVELLRLLLPDRRRLLGGTEAETLRTTHMLARNLIGLGETKEATALLREVAAVRERVLGNDHPHTRRARRDLEALIASSPRETDIV